MALITASAKGHLETAKLLLQHGALVNFQSKVRVLYVYGAHGVPGTEWCAQFRAIKVAGWAGHFV